MASFLCLSQKQHSKKKERARRRRGKQSRSNASPPKCRPSLHRRRRFQFRSIPPFQIYLVQRQLDHHLALARVLKVAGFDDLGGRASVEAAAASPAKATTATTAAAAAKRRSASSAAGGEASSAPASSAAREASAASTAIHLESLVARRKRDRREKASLSSPLVCFLARKK